MSRSFLHPRRRARYHAALGGLLTVTLAAGSAGVSEAEAANLNKADLEFVLQQIKISEANTGANLSGPGALQVNNPLFPYGVRTVTGEYNNLLPGREKFGAADTTFIRLTDPLFRMAEALTFDPDGPGPLSIGDSTSYTQKKGIVEDSAPRTISNLISDQTAANPAAATAAANTPGSQSIDHDSNPATPDLLFIPNRATDDGASAPYNSWFTLFGQFFDHGLDLVTKGNSGTVFIPLKDDDPLIVGADGIAGTGDDPANPPPVDQRFMVLTRATNLPGPDGRVGDNPATPFVDESADDIRQHTNTTSSFVDQNQTYTSHPSHQVFLREYDLDGAGKPVANGRLLERPVVGGLARWADIKEQAETKLGIALSDVDVLNVPLLATDEYGKFLRGPNGYPQIVKPGNVLVEGDPSAPITTAGAIKTGHAFLDDIAHHAVPFGDHDGVPSTPRQALAPDSLAGTGEDNDPATYDDEMLVEHFVTGDGRGNENIGLTAVHAIFHSEHNRLVGAIKQTIADSADAAFIAQWKLSNGDWNGERLFQAARFGTEMQYQHLVFEEFARKVQPQVNIFAGYDADIDASIVAEFAHTVYRFGHSMLTDDVARVNPDGTPNDIGLIAAFLNPLAFTDNGTGTGTLTPEEAAGSIVTGMTRQVGSELDEFVVPALRSNLLGLPLDLGALNIARGRETGVVGLNAARRDFYAKTAHSALQPYESWNDFKLGLRHPASLLNFVAAYGTHPDLIAQTKLADKRLVAKAILDNAPVTLSTGPYSPPVDRHAFLNSSGAWVSSASGVTTTGVDAIDFWIGGLAERQMPFGGMLGSTFNFVFETQMERLQDGDRFYYLARTAGLNFLTQLEENSFAELVMQNTDATKHLPFDIFSTPDYTFEFANLINPGDGSIQDDPLTPYSETDLLTQMNEGTVRFVGGEHIVMGGTPGADRMRSDDGDDTLWGDGGNDRLEGGAGNDALNGNDGDDIITDQFGDDNIKGGEGDDAINAGSGFDLLLAGGDKDFVVAGADPKETFAGAGDDFVIAGDSADTVFGNEGDDWIQGGDQADLLQGGNQTPFEDDTKTGDDVIFGEGGNDDYDSEGGDDIMVTGPGVERLEGMLGFDWATYKGDAQPANADMRFTGLQPPDAANVRDRFDLTEGLSGWTKDDILRGDSRDATPGAEGTFAGHELNNIAKITGLQGILGAGATQFTGGNIILGGGGSDLMEGRGGDDILHGDAQLSVQLEAPIPGPPANDTQLVDGMAAVQADVFAGRIDPGEITIVRRIDTPAAGATDVDTAEFSGPRADYDIVPDGNDPTRVTVVHARGSQIDGTDVLIKVERARFADQVIKIDPASLNEPAGGTVSVSDLTPIEGQTLTASQAIIDPEGFNAAGIVFNWQAEEDPGVWVTVGTGPSFVVGDPVVGLRLRVVATFRDGQGVHESVASAPTGVVGNVNDVPTGRPVINDDTPITGQLLTALTGGIADADGLGAFSYQWQEVDGSGTADIAGATTQTYTVGADKVGKRIQVRVSYTDANGTNEAVTSLQTAPVTAPPVAPPAPLIAPLLRSSAPVGLSGLRIVQRVATSGASAPVAFQFRLGGPATVRIDLRKRNGQLVKRIVRKANRGTSRITWSLRDRAGKRVAPGVYRIIIVVTHDGVKKVTRRTFRVR